MLFSAGRNVIIEQSFGGPKITKGMYKEPHHLYRVVITLELCVVSYGHFREPRGRVVANEQAADTQPLSF